MNEKFTVESIEHSQRHDEKSGAPLYAVDLTSERYRLRMHVANPAIGGVLAPGTEVWFEDPGATEAVGEAPTIEVTGAELLAEPAVEPAHATPPPLPVLATAAPAAEVAPVATSTAPVVTP